MGDLEGLVLVSRDFGYGKITSHLDGRVRIRFVGHDRDAWYGVQDIAAQKSFKWKPMPIGLRCRVLERGICTIAEATFQPTESNGVHEYLVVFDGDAGETARMTERDLWPIPGSLAETPLTRLTGLQAGAVDHFRARADLLDAFTHMFRSVGGIGALASSRISILPHQAFVVGTVVDDPIWRYVLADEVGLGKTIEAGVVAHQLLATKADAKILVLCPGPLSRQWLCEMHTSFAGRDFHLLDLHHPDAIRLPVWPLVISSLKVATRHHATAIEATEWDLLIVDEAHQLLWNEQHYALVERLARRTPRLLLLSAIPARERETELLRLLRLIDAARYEDGSPVTKRFGQLYAAQAALGRRVRLVSRQLEGAEDLDREQLRADVQNLLFLDVLREDEGLRELARSADASIGDGSLSIDLYRQLMEDIVARYRISRRIVKNRRARLADAALITSVAREVVIEEFTPSALESEIAAVALELLEPLGDRAREDAFQVVFRKMAQSQCDVVALYDIANTLVMADETASGEQGAPVDVNAILDYDEHEALLESSAASIAGLIEGSKLRRWLALLKAAIEVRQTARTKSLIACVDRLKSEGRTKVLIFAGSYGTAEFVAESLAHEYGKAAVASFRHDLADDDKEVQVTRFRRDAKCLFLVSDESGGEGRNFQFADALVHFDLPWSVAAIEQRIGRLDRIGRDRTVRSYVICPNEGLERAWLECLVDGFGVFTRSISGLEFLLRETERSAVLTAAREGPSGLIESVASIRDACERERANDDAEAVTDAASFRSTRYLKSVSGESVDEQLEEALPRYLRVIGGPQVAKRITDDKDVNLRIWRLRPEDVTDYKLAGLERDGANPLRDRHGTFDRLVARDRRDLEFFTVGHPLVDALATATREHVGGRSFMIRAATDVLPPGTYLLSAWRPVKNHRDREQALSERALRLLDERIVWAGIDLETGEGADPTAVERLVGQVRTKPSLVNDLNGDAALEAFRPEPAEWGTTLKEMLARVADSAMARYAERYAAVDTELCQQLISDAESASRARPEESAEYAFSLRDTAAIIRSAKLELDILGLLKAEAALASA